MLTAKAALMTSSAAIRVPDRRSPDRRGITVTVTNAGSLPISLDKRYPSAHHPAARCAARARDDTPLRAFPSDQCPKARGQLVAGRRDFDRPPDERP